MENNGVFETVRQKTQSFKYNDVMKVDWVLGNNHV
jgi:hypothetical protein